MILRVALLVVLFNAVCYGQEKPSDFVLDHSKPWVFIRLDHIGPRAPASLGEGDVGLYLRLVNNCRLPIDVAAVGVIHSSGVETLIDWVVPVEEGWTFSNRIEWDDRESPPERPRLPMGYNDSLSPRKILTINPGEELLFSAPRNHVSKSWYMQVRVSLDVGDSKRGLVSPKTYVDFKESDLPGQVLPKSNRSQNK